MTKIMNFLNQVKERRFDTYETLALLMFMEKNIWNSWGVSQIVHLESNALGIWCNAHRLCGWCVIVLQGDDLYRYYILNQDYTVRKRVDSIFCEDLVGLIDRDIEWVPEYGKPSDN